MLNKPRLNVVLDEDMMVKFKELCENQGVVLSVAVRELIEGAIRENIRFKPVLVKDKPKHKSGKHHKEN